MKSTTASSLHAIAIIPARGGSKRIPRKNLLPLAGLPLVAHTVRHAVSARSISETYVSTDDDEIARVARTHGAEVIVRPAELATDEAGSEPALLHVLDDRRARGLADPDVVVFLQCTSPVRGAGDIDAAVAQLDAEGADSLLSATARHGFLWRVDTDGAAAINYDPRERRREQDLAPQWLENGSIYVTRTEVLRERRNRIGGRVAIYGMGYWSSFQLDDPEDARLLDWILTEIRPSAPS